MLLLLLLQLLLLMLSLGIVTHPLLLIVAHLLVYGRAWVSVTRAWHPLLGEQYALLLYQTLVAL